MSMGTERYTWSADRIMIHEKDWDYILCIN